MNNNYPDPLSYPHDQDAARVHGNQEAAAGQARGTFGAGNKEAGAAGAGNLDAAAAQNVSATAGRPNISAAEGQGVVEQKAASAVSHSPANNLSAGPLKANHDIRSLPRNSTKSKIGLIIMTLVIGLALGGVLGYLIGDLLVFKPALKKEADARVALEDRVFTLEAGGTINQTGTTANNSGQAASEDNLSDNQGGTKIIQGITADDITKDWPTYSNTEHHFSFKYPSNYEVKELSDQSDKLLFGVGVFKKGEPFPSAFVRVYKSTQNEGPAVTELAGFFWPPLLPQSITEKVVGAGRVKDVKQKQVIVNGNQATELSATQGSGLEPKPGAEIYKAYVLPDLFEATYLVGTCGTDQTQQKNLVACPLLTTFTVL